MDLIIAAVFVFGVFVGIIFTKIRSVGTLRMNTSDPDGPYLFLELHNGIDDIGRKKHVTFKVQIDSQE